jgi:acetyl/propionyl-CoA carboxylase alpha subunit
MKLFVDWKGQKYSAEAQRVDGKVWVHFQGNTFVLEKEERLKRKKGSSGSARTGDVVAPMPGKVTKLMVQANSHVNKGDSVVVMEAMKMEYTLKADGDGEVTKINCQVGEQVSLGKILVQIEPRKNSNE